MAPVADGESGLSPNCNDLKNANTCDGTTLQIARNSSSTLDPLSEKMKL
jgi:hypothetical protein